MTIRTHVSFPRLLLKHQHFVSYSILLSFESSMWISKTLKTAPLSPEVSRIHWWMSAFGSETAKPQYAYSNSPSIRKVYHYAPTSFNKVVDTKVTTCRQYKNKAGKDCWVGTAQLKDTEILGCDKISPRTDRFEKHSLIHTHAHASPSALPRIYPDLFGLTISELLDDLRSNQRGCPKLPECVPTAFQSMAGAVSGTGENLFDHADLQSVYRYLRGCTHLCIPQDWECQFPKTIWMVGLSRVCWVPCSPNYMFFMFLKYIVGVWIRDLMILVGFFFRI